MPDSIETILKKDPHIVEIVPGEVVEFTRIDSSGFNDDKEDAQYLVENCLEKFVASPCIVDNFENHSQRREWIPQMCQTYGKEVYQFYNSNCLRVNVFRSVASTAMLFYVIYEGKEKDTFRKLAKNVMDSCNSGGNYDKFTIAEKLAFVKNIKKQIIPLIDFLAEKKVK